VKGREPARIMIAIGNKKENRRHLQFAQRWVVQYNFYINDGRWGRMFVRGGVQPQPDFRNRRAHGSGFSGLD
jgi:hypothetical protein